MFVYLIAIRNCYLGKANCFFLVAPLSMHEEKHIIYLFSDDDSIGMSDSNFFYIHIS